MAPMRSYVYVRVCRQRERRQEDNTGLDSNFQHQKHSPQTKKRASFITLHTHAVLFVRANKSHLLRYVHVVEFLGLLLLLLSKLLLLLSLFLHLMMC